MDLRNRVTIVIPTFRREAKALRALSFWAGQGFRVLMLDGSEKPLTLPAAAVDDPDITYMHLPIPLSERLGHAAGEITTDFTVLCGDDDFMLPTALDRCAEFLDGHPDYAACGGQTLGFSKGAGGQLRAFVRYPGFLGFDNNHATPSDRIQAHFGSYLPASVYALCRTKVWVASMQLWSRHEFPVYAIGELQFEFRVALAGKVRRLPVLHWLRSHEVAQKGHQRAGKADVSLSRRLTVPIVWQEPDHAGLRNEIVATTAGVVADQTGRHQADIAADFEAAIAAYLGNLQAASEKGSGRRRLRNRLSKAWARARLPFGFRIRQLRRLGVDCPAGDLARVRAAMRGR